MDDEEILGEDFEKVPGTWAYELKNHWEVFSAYCWKTFNKCSEHTVEENVDFLKWREYMLWDMCRRHKEELQNGIRNNRDEISS
ncbi:MAG: hypothetical protein KGZ39_00375 [Simkania sp.]|nr:hypothetical protein [Simkania sp.]